MAGRRSSSRGSGGGCLGVIIVLAIIGFIMQSWPYLLLIAGCILGIWFLVKLFQKLYAQGNGTATRVNTATKANAIVNSNYNTSSDVCYEVDRQIKETLVRRRELQKKISRIKAEIVKHSFFWMKNNEKHVQAREELTEELNLLEGRLNAAVYVFREPITKEFTRLKTAFNALFNASAKTYDSTPPNGQLSISYSPKSDMQCIIFSVEPLCISLGDNIFCIAPYYIVHFKKSGAYVSTYSCKAIKGGVANGSYDERVKHVTWTYTRADGMPDRRYKNNPQRVYYTTTTHTVWNMLALGLLNYQLKYEVTESIKNELIAAIKAYSALLPIKSYDPVYHLVRLLKECDNSNPNIDKLENIISGGNSNLGRKENDDRDVKSTHLDIDQNPAYSGYVQKDKWGAWDVIKTVLEIGLGAISGIFAVIMLLGTIVYLFSADWSTVFVFLSLTGFAGIVAFLWIREAVRIIKGHSNISYVPDKNPAVRLILIIAAILLVFSLIVGVVIGGSGNTSTTIDEQTIEQITSKWETDGQVDYTDVALFEKAVNDGEDLIGKTVAFTVVDVRPDSALGHNLYGGEHLNFVSDEDPGVKTGDEITVMVTKVKHILTDSYEISYVLLNE